MTPLNHPAGRPGNLQAAARSLRFFGGYMCLTGVGLLLAPALVLAPLQLPVPTDVWVRLVGVLALALGTTDVITSKVCAQTLDDTARLLLQASVWRRLAAGLVLLALVAVAVAPPAVLLFAAVDLAAAGWTALALRGQPVPQLQRA